MSLLDHKSLLFPVEKLEKYVVDPDVELDFSSPNIDPSLDVI